MTTIANIHIEADGDSSESFATELARLLREYATFLDECRAGTDAECERYESPRGSAMTISVSTLSDRPVPHEDDRLAFEARVSARQSAMLPQL